MSRDNALVSIWKSKDSTRADDFVASGFFVADCLVLTAKHVLKISDKLWARPRVGGQASYLMSDAKPHDELDVTLLKIDLMPQGTQALVPLLDDKREQLDVDMLGYFDGRREEVKAVQILNYDQAARHFVFGQKQPQGQSGGALCVGDKVWGMPVRHYVDPNTHRGCAIAIHHFWDWLRQYLPASASNTNPTSNSMGVGNPARAFSAETSKLQLMLWRYLADHWQQISGHPRFQKAEVIEGCAKPLTIDGVFDAVTTSDCEDVLEGLRSCFDDSNFTRVGGAPMDRSSEAFQALTFIALVAAERFVLGEQAQLDGLPKAPHEPIPGQEPVLAAVVAAAIFRFGLRFKPDNRLPVSVLYAKPPAAELGNPGEEGASLFRKELLAMANRIELGDEHDLRGMDSVPDRRLKRLVERVARKLDCPVALCADASGALSTLEARQRLLVDMKQLGVTAFFSSVAHDESPRSISDLYKELNVLLTPFFFQTSTSPENLEMSKPESLSPNISVVNNFNAPVATIAQANAQGAVAAGRDVIQNGIVSDPLALLLALRNVVESHPVLSAAPAKQAQFIEYVDDIRGVVEKDKEQRTESEVRLVKRCLDGLKQGADAMENGSTILEKLSPLWDGLKATWPALAILFT